MEVQECKSAKVQELNCDTLDYFEARRDPSPVFS